MDVASSEFFIDKDKAYDLNFKEEVVLLFPFHFLGIHDQISWTGSCF